jgi:hypothetical protein
MNMYQELVDEGCNIPDLLRANAGNVGDMGVLLEAAAAHIEALEANLKDTRDYFAMVDKIAKSISQNNSALQETLRVAKVFGRIK